MKFVIAPDKFKGSLSSEEACEAIKAGIISTFGTAETILLPMADGGDGLLDTLARYSSYKSVSTRVSDPLFRPLNASYLISEDHSAFIEMAKASGLMLLKAGERNPAITSTYGTGELIKDALQRGATRITLGIGGSATNDAGIGMAAALGFRFLDKDGKELLPTGENLIRIARIDNSRATDLSAVIMEVACDVTNVLHGESGAAYIFGPQKGADEKMVNELDKGLLHIAGVIKKDLGADVGKIPGAGAAGGLGGGAIAFLGAKLRSGIELVLEHSHAEEHIRSADMVITGEGKLDRQSLNGKVISGISSLCQKHGKSLIVMCGRNELEPGEYKAAGITKVFSLLEFAPDADNAFRDASYWLKFISEKAMRE